MKSIFTIISLLFFSSLIAQNANFVWAKQMGGTNFEYGQSSTVDAAGNVYTTGYFNGTAYFDPGPGTVNFTSAGTDDIFITKSDASGNLIWARQMGGTGSDQGFSIAVDALGNVYTTGAYLGTADFDPGVATFNLTSLGSGDIFVSKLNSSGNFVWAKSMGGAQDDKGIAVAIDVSGNVYTTGLYHTTADFDPGPATFNLTTNGNQEIFISKLDASGNFVWAKSMGGSLDDNGNGIAVDASGNVYSTGFFNGTVDFDPGAGTTNLISAGSGDAYISKLDASGNFVWAKNLGGADFDDGFSIAVDASGNVYTTGIFNTTGDFDPGAGIFNLTSAGNDDIYISKLNSSGGFIWAKRLGGTDFDDANSLALDASGNVYTTGYFSGTADFDPGAGTVNLTTSGQGAFVSKLDASGNFVLAKQLSGNTTVIGNSVALDGSGNIIVTGFFSGTADFDPNATIYNLTPFGGSDIFTVKLSQGASSTTDFFRTKASGNWDDINTWESSSDGTTFVPATLTPNFNANTVTINTGHTVKINNNLTIDQTIINTGGAVEVNPLVVLIINNGAGTDLTINSGATFTLKSTATGTASIGNSAGSMSGNTTVERFISNKRAWRLLGIPFTISTQTIKNSWMENGATTPGFGTQITTYPGDPNLANFDGTGIASSIRIYSGGTFTSDATHTPNTSNIITTNPSYFLFVRGDRSVSRLTTASPSSATTLRITGVATQGNISTVGTTGSSFSLIKNPYPSTIDFDKVKNNGDPFSDNAGVLKFYLWDATLAGPNGVGQYRTIDITGNAPNYTYTATPGGADNKWRFIESGAAFFVPGSKQLDFTEAVKISTTNTPPSSVFRVATVNQTELLVNLNIINADNSVSLADGIREVFDNSYAAGIDNNDAKKITGFDMNLGITSNNEILAIEKRPLPTVNDVIVLKLWNAQQGNYQFEIQPSSFSAGLTPFLYDTYMDSYTPIDVNADTKINFSISSVAASAANNRFSIVFTNPKNAVSGNTPGIFVYPNPVQNGVIQLRMNNMPKGIYSVRLINNLGQIIFTRKIDHAESSSLETISINKIKGTYMLEVIKPDNSRFANKLIIN